MWSALNSSRKGGGYHEANDRSCGNGCALSGQLYSCTDRGFSCNMCAVVLVLVFFGSVCSAVAMGGGRPLSSLNELLSMTVLITSWWMLLIVDL